MNKDIIMNRLSKNIWHLIALVLVLGVSSCAKPAIEVVEFDDSYALDKNIISVEKPEAINYNPNNIIKLNGKSEVRLLGNVKDGVSTMPKKSFTVRFRLRRALDKELKVLLSEDRSKLSEYPDSQVGLQPFPEGALKEYEATIPAGVLQHEVQFELDDVSKFTDERGYLTALALTLHNGEKEIALSQKNHIVFLKIEISELIAGYNLTLITDTDQENTTDAENVVYSSNATYGRVGELGKYNWNPVWWVQEGSKTYLDVKFDTAPISQVTFHCALRPKNKTVRGVRVQVSNNGGKTFVDQGYLDVLDARRYVNFKFNTPQEINMIRFSEFKTYSNDSNDRWVDLYSVFIYY